MSDINTEELEVKWIEVVDHEKFMGIKWRPISLSADPEDSSLVNFEIEGTSELVATDEFKSYAGGYVQRALIMWMEQNNAITNVEEATPEAIEKAKEEESANESDQTGTE